MIPLRIMCRAEGYLDKAVTARYSSYSGVDLSKTSFPELEAKALKAGEPVKRSAQQETYEMLFNRYV